MSLSVARPPQVSPEQWERALGEFATYRRELLRLLNEGHAGRYALVKDDLVVSVWDTVGDALQAAEERFGALPVATFKINPLDVDRFAFLDAQTQPSKEAVCPP
jgi:hypothetical protein